MENLKQQVQGSTFRVRFLICCHTKAIVKSAVTKKIKKIFRTVLRDDATPNISV